jgi:ABC-type transport system substrate-binding protein
MKIISDQTSAFMALQNGEIDLLWYISADQIQTVYASDDLELLLTGKNMMIYLGMNSGNEALSDFRVRKAIYLAVNRDDIIRGAYDGLAFLANSILTPESVGYNTDYDANSPFPERNIEEARALMEEAGYGDGLTLRLLAESTINFQLVTEQLSAQLGEIGITLEPQLTDSATEGSMLFSGDTSLYDMYLYVSQCANDAVSFLDNPMLFGASHPELSADGSGDGWRALWDQVRSEPSIDKRIELYKEVQTYFFEEGLYWLPLAVSQTYVGVNKDLTGMQRGGIMIYFDQAYYR